MSSQMISDDESNSRVSDTQTHCDERRTETVDNGAAECSKVIVNGNETQKAEIECEKPNASVPIIVEPICENGTQCNTNIETQICDKVNNVTLNDEYPSDYNPFGDDDGDEEEDKANYPQDLNPFGDDSETEEPNQQKLLPSNANVSVSSVKEYDNSLNPFGSDDDEQSQEPSRSSLPVTPVPAPRRSVRGFANTSLSNQSSYSTSSLERKSKRPTVPPPRPPPPTALSPDASMKQSATSVSLDSEKLSPSPVNSTPERTKKVFKKKPAPKPPGLNEDNSIKSDVISDVVSVESGSIPATPEMIRRSPSRRSSREYKESMSPPVSIHSISSTSENDCSVEVLNESVLENPKYASYWRNKKRKAPPIPIPMRVITKGSIEEIQKELNEIGDKLVANDSRTMEILEIMQRVGVTHKQRKLINEYLLLSHEKCSLAKKQEELMYLKREHKLEEDHADTEYKLRIIMAKPDSMRSEEDEEKEQQLLQRLVEIIEERNDIVENVIKIDKRVDFNILVDKVKQIKGESVVAPILKDFMKNHYNEKAVKSSDVKYRNAKSQKAKNKTKTKSDKSEKSGKSGKSALNSLKKIVK